MMVRLLRNYQIRGRGSVCFAFFLFSFFIATGIAQAGFNVWGPAPQDLDGQTVDWITIGNPGGDPGWPATGTGILKGGTLNVGVEGLTNSGDLKLWYRGLFDADQIGAGVFQNEQYQGTINVGPRIEMLLDSKMILSDDTLNVLGRSDTGNGLFQVYSGSMVDITNSNIWVSGKLDVADVGSSYQQSGGTLAFGDELVVDKGSLTAQSMQIMGGAQPGRSSFGDTRGDVVLNSGAILSLQNSTLDNTGGTQSRLIVSSSTLSLISSAVKVNRIELWSPAISLDNADLLVTDGGYLNGLAGSPGALSMAGGSFKFGDEVSFDHDAHVSVSNGGVMGHQNTGDGDNRGLLWVTDNSSLSFTGSGTKLDLTSGVFNDLDVLGGSALNVTDNAGVNLGGTLVVNNSAAFFDTATVKSKFLGITSGTAVADHNSTLEITDTVFLRNGGSLSLQNGSQLTTSIIDINHDPGYSGGSLDINSGSGAQATGARVIAGQINLDGGSLTLADGLIVGEWYDPTGTVALSNGASLQVGTDLNVGAVFTAQDATVTAGRLNGEKGQISLDGTNLTTNTLDLWSPTISLDNATVLVTDGGFLNGLAGSPGALSMAGGSFKFGDEVSFDHDAHVSVSNGGVMGHQNTGDGDNRGLLWVTDNSSLSITGSGTQVDLTTGLNNELNVLRNSQLSVTNQATVNVEKLSVSDTGSEARFENSTLNTKSLRISGGATFEEIDSIINVTGNTTTVEAGSKMILDGGAFTEAGDFFLYGALEGSNPLMAIGIDFFIGDVASMAFSDSAQLLIGDDFLGNLANPSALTGMQYLTIEMLGTSDDDGSGEHLFEMAESVLLGGLSIDDGVNILLTGDLWVRDLMFLGNFGTIDLNDHKLIVASNFTGNTSQIIGNGTFDYSPNAPVPEPSAIVLLCSGLLGMAVIKIRSRK